MAMTDQQLSYLSVLTALNKMMAGKYFDICTVDTAAQALGTIPDGAARSSAKAGRLSMTTSTATARLPGRQFATQCLSRTDLAVATGAWSDLAQRFLRWRGRIRGTSTGGSRRTAAATWCAQQPYCWPRLSAWTATRRPTGC